MAVRSQHVSPGFRPRPSLSAVTGYHVERTIEVSPGFRPRPSLSGSAVGRGWRILNLCRRGLGPGLR